MIQQLPSQICPYCEKKTPKKNFCIHCGHDLLNTTICPSCHTAIPINTFSCPFCNHNFSSSELNNELKNSVYLNLIFTKFRLGILVIFLLSVYSLTQMMIGSVFFLLFPANISIDPINQALLSLLVIMISNTILIVVLLKWKTFTLQLSLQERSFFSHILILLLLLITSISIIEIVITIIDFGLDLIHVDPTLVSPYDEYFSTPLNLLAFTILITILGPIFEELIFRRYTISIMLNHNSDSKFLVVCTSALIFSLSHTAINVIRSVRYAVLHMFATFILGMILAIIFLRWGLKYAIFFHSFWNAYSLIVQLLINDGALQLVDQIISLFVIITLILTTYLAFRSRSILGSLKLKVSLPSRPYLLFFMNLILIITYELIIPLFLLSLPSSILTAGLTFLYQTCAFLLGVKLIDKGKKMTEGFNTNQLDFDAF